MAALSLFFNACQTFHNILTIKNMNSAPFTVHNAILLAGSNDPRNGDAVADTIELTLAELR